MDLFPALSFWLKIPSTMGHITKKKTKNGLTVISIHEVLHCDPTLASKQV